MPNLRGVGVAGDAGTGADLYHAKSGWYGSKPEFSEALREAGIPGIRYLDAGSRGSGQGTSNYALFDDSLAKILKRE